MREDCVVLKRYIRESGLIRHQRLCILRLLVLVPVGDRPVTQQERPKASGLSRRAHAVRAPGSRLQPRPCFGRIAEEESGRGERARSHNSKTSEGTTNAMQYIFKIIIHENGYHNIKISPLLLLPLPLPLTGRPFHHKRNLKRAISMCYNES